MLKAKKKADRKFAVKKQVYNRGIKKFVHVCVCGRVTKDGQQASGKRRGRVMNRPAV